MDKRDFLKKIFSMTSLCLLISSGIFRDDIHILRNFLDKKNPRRDIIVGWEDDELKEFLDMADDYFDVCGRIPAHDERIQYAASVAYQTLTVLYLDIDNEAASAYRKTYNKLRTEALKSLERHTLL